MSTLVVWLAIATLAVVVAVPFGYEYVYGDGFDPFAPIFWVAPLFFLTFGAHAAMRALSGDYTFRGAFIEGASLPTVVAEVVIFAAIGLSAVCIGYYWHGSATLGRRLPTFRSSWSSRRAWSAIGVLMGVGLLGFFGLQPDLGSGPRSELAKGGSKFAFIAVNMLNLASILAIADSFIGWPDDRLRPSRWMLIKAGVAVVLVGSNALLLWQLDGRARAFGILIIGMFLFHYLFRRLSFPQGMGFFAVVKIVPGWAIGILTSIIALDFAAAFSELTNPFLFLASPFTRLNNAVVIFEGVPGRVDYQGGATFASAFFELVPFEPFPQTQIVFGRLMPFDGTDFAAPITLLAELHLNFGPLGVVLGLLLVGIIMRVVYVWLVTSTPTAASLVLFALLANTFLLWGNFSNGFPKLGMKVLPMLAALVWIAGGVKWTTRAENESTYAPTD